MTLSIRPSSGFSKVAFEWNRSLKAWVNHRHTVMFAGTQHIEPLPLYQIPGCFSGHFCSESKNIRVFHIWPAIYSAVSVVIPAAPTQPISCQAMQLGYV